MFLVPRRYTKILSPQNFNNCIFANYVETTRSHASLRSRAPVGFLPHHPSLCLDFNFPYAHTSFYSLFLSRSIICSLFLFSCFLNRKLFVFVFSIFFSLGRSIISFFSFYSYPYLIGFGDQIRSHKQASAFCETQDFTITHFIMISISTRFIFRCKIIIKI